MPLPLAPVAVLALRCGAVALTTWAAHRALRQLPPGRRDQRAEDALDELPEGLTLHTSPQDGTRRVTARLNRRLRLGQSEWQLEAALLTRLRLKKV